MAVREIPYIAHPLRELAELVFAVPMAIMAGPLTLPLPPLATLTSITSQPKADGAARVVQAAMVDFLPVVERVDEVDRVILAPAQPSREGVAEAARVEKAARGVLAVWVGPVLTAAKAGPSTSLFPATGPRIGRPTLTPEAKDRAASRALTARGGPGGFGGDPGTGGSNRKSPRQGRRNFRPRSNGSCGRQHHRCAKPGHARRRKRSRHSQHFCESNQLHAGSRYLWRVFVRWMCFRIH